MNEIDDHGLVTATQQETPERRGRSELFEGRAELIRDVDQRRRSILQAILGGEEIEILGRAVAEVEAGKGRAAGQEEAALAPEESLQNSLLKAIERHRTRDALAGSSG